MVSFIVSIVLLVLGYIFYGRFVAKVFGADSERVTPAISSANGVDYVPMPAWKVFLIQFLNFCSELALLFFFERYTRLFQNPLCFCKFNNICYVWS